MKSSRLALSLLFFLSNGAAAIAEGQGAPDDGHGAFRQACDMDVQTYCSSAQSREDRHSCMHANIDKLSDACKTFIANHHHQHDQMDGHGTSQ